MNSMYYQFFYKLMRYKAFCMLMLCVLHQGVYAQSVNVTGKVTSDTGEGLPGVNVLIKGTANGTTTNAEGTYALAVADPNSTLTFSYIGFITEEVPLTGRTSVDVQLLPDIKTLSEVVVIGYGEKEKKDLTGSVAAIQAEDIAKSVSVQPEMAMQGRIAGVFVSTPGGNPNARPTVRIRGVSTFGYAEPLYVIDGVPITEYGNGQTEGIVGDLRGQVNVLNLINPNDIESISVLKDASAAAIYGVRAANGVVLITTKRGAKGRPKVEISASRGIQNIIKTYDMLNVEQFTALYREAYANNPNEASKLPAQFDPASPNYLGNSPTYDWQTPLLNKNAILEDYSARVFGGNEATTYYVSGGYSRTESPLIQNNLDRYSFAANINSKVSKYLSTGVTYRLGYVKALDNTGTDLHYVAGTSPWQAIYNADGSYAPAVAMKFKPNPAINDTIYGPRPLAISPIPLYITDGDAQLLYGPETNNNVYGQQATRRTDYTLVRNLGTAFIQVEPLTGLRFKGTLSVDWYYNQRNDWTAFENYQYNQTPGNPYNNNDGRSKGNYGQRHSRNLNLVKEFSINYNKNFGKHNVDVLLNAMDQRYRFDLIFASSSQINFADPQYRDINNVSPYVSGSSMRDVNALQGYMGRVSYNYASKYYFDATVRRDGSSRFAPGYRWGTFPSFSAAWRVSGENFMQAVPLINDLKIRGGWGRLGNQETASFAYLSRIATTSDYALGSGNGNALGGIRYGVVLPDIPVQTLSWETAQTTNIGVDGALWDNRITFTVEYYRRTTKDILQESGLPASVGVQNRPGTGGLNNPVLNIATVRNTGVELQAGYNGKVGDLTFNVSGNITTVRNRAVKLFNNTPFGNEGGRIEVGYPIFFLWGYKVGGVFQDTTQINTYQETNSDNISGDKQEPGDLWFQDVHGEPSEAERNKTYTTTPDSVVDSYDRTFIGKTIPGYFYGFNLSAAFKGFDVSVFFQGVGDVQRYNFERSTREDMGSTGVNQLVSTLNRWTPENPSTTMPRAIRDDPAQNNRFSDRYVENAGFLRLKNFQVGYSLPKSLLQNLGFIENFRIYFSGTNVLTFTNWTGLDPEVGRNPTSVTTQNLQPGEIIPPTRSFVIGLNATF